MKKLLMTVLLCVATAAFGMTLTACNQVKKELRKVMNVTEKKSADAAETTQKSLDLKAAEVMDLFIDWKPNTWSDITRRLGLTVYGRGIQRQEDLTMDFFEKNIDYDETTDKFKKNADDAIGIAMLSQEVDGESWELMLANKADYDALMDGMASEQDYKENPEMQKSLNESPDMTIDKVYMKAVYDEELSKMAGKRLGVGYYIMFEGERDGLYIISFSHGNGDVEME
ncbi:MAG: hypothetical protein IKO37_03880 [Prevotella sp.]|nr:hypothetical protein [Prevotella sp.]